MDIDRRLGALSLADARLTTRLNEVVHLRDALENAIDRLIGWLDTLDPDADREPTFGDRSLGYLDEAEPDEDLEPSLGWPENHGVGAEHGSRPVPNLEDGEAEEDDPSEEDDPAEDADPGEDDGSAEPTLGWPEHAAGKGAHGVVDTGCQDATLDGEAELCEPRPEPPRESICNVTVLPFVRRVA